MVSAQVSIYPLRQPHLSAAVRAVAAALAAHGLDAEVGPMSTLVRGEPKAVFAALGDAFAAVAAVGQVVMVVTMSNACSSGSE